MTKEVDQAIRMLFDLVTGLEPRLSGLESWFLATTNKIDVWALSEGNQGIKRAKDAFSRASLLMFGEEAEPLDFCKSEGGCPTLVKPLVDRVLSLPRDERLLSAALSLCRVTDLWDGKSQDSTVLQQLQTINESQLPSSALPVLEEFPSFLAIFKKRYPHSPMVQAMGKPIPYARKSGRIERNSRGPNGPLTLSAHRDVICLDNATCIDGRCLFDHVEDLMVSLNKVEGRNLYPKYNEDFRPAIETYQRRTGYIHDWSDSPGKISLIHEKSGKIRLVASPDYFSQVALEPLHRWLMNCLQNIPADCTFDQRSALPKMQAWQLKGNFVYSFDQSSCTDLFPFEFQLSVLRGRFGSPVCESVRSVMVDRDWELKLPSGKTKTVRWSVGQPMGLMASWPLMALSHHLLVQYARWISCGRSFPRGDKPFDRYVICGDDIVIADRAVAQAYLSVVKRLGMKVNKSKSHISGGTTGVDPISEFAKVTVWKGRVLFPIRPRMVLSAIRDWRQAVPLITDIRQLSGFSAKRKTVERVIRHHLPKGGRYLIPLLSIPLELGGCGFRDSVSMAEKFSHIDAGQIHPWLYYLGSRIRAGLVQDFENSSSTGPMGLPNIKDRKVLKLHPAFEAQFDRLAEEDSHQSTKRFWLLEEIPTIPEICLDLCANGWESYNDFLPTCSKDLNNPPWGPNERELLRSRTHWEKALKRKHFFPQRLDREHRVPHTLVLEAALPEDPVVRQRRSAQRQYDVVVGTMLAERVTAR